MKASARARSMPAVCLWRSGVLPWLRIASAMVARSASSSAVSGVTTPSPLKRIEASHSPRSEMSASVRVLVPSLPSRSRMRRPSFASSAPGAFAPSRSSSDSVPPPESSTSALRSRSQAHWQAAITSGGRTRPSRSVSIKSNVRGSKSMPRVGQASATQSFWSSSAMRAMSSPLRNTTWSTPPARMNCQRCGAGAGAVAPGVPAACAVVASVIVPAGLRPRPSCARRGSSAVRR